jgi:hypothetical protein
MVTWLSTTDTAFGVATGTRTEKRVNRENGRRGRTGLGFVFARNARHGISGIDLER